MNEWNAGRYTHLALDTFPFLFSTRNSCFILNPTFFSMAFDARHGVLSTRSASPRLLHGPLDCMAVYTHSDYRRRLSFVGLSAPACEL